MLLDRGCRNHGQGDRLAQDRGQPVPGSEGRDTEAGEGQGPQGRDQEGSRRTRSSARARSRARGQVHPGTRHCEGRRGPRGLSGKVRTVSATRSDERGKGRGRVQHNHARYRGQEARGGDRSWSPSEVVLPQVRTDRSAARIADRARGNGGNREYVRGRESDRGSTASARGRRTR